MGGALSTDPPPVHTPSPPDLVAGAREPPPERDPDLLPTPRKWYIGVERAKYRYLLLRSFLVWVDRDSCAVDKCTCYKTLFRARLLLRSLLTASPDPFAISESVGAQLDRALEIESELAGIFEDGMCIRQTPQQRSKEPWERVFGLWCSEVRSL